MTAERRRRRTVLVGTFLVFFVPIMAAWLLNVFAPGWRPFGTLNHGTLVEPVRQVSATDLARVDGSALSADYLSGRWTLVHLLDGDCGQTCIAALARSRQVPGRWCTCSTAIAGKLASRPWRAAVRSSRRSATTCSGCNYCW